MTMVGGWVEGGLEFVVVGKLGSMHISVCSSVELLWSRLPSSQFGIIFIAAILVFLFCAEIQSLFIRSSCFLSMLIGIVVWNLWLKYNRRGEN